jgi:hypothetical protein
LFDGETFKKDTKKLFVINFGGLYSSKKILQKVPFTKGFIYNDKIRGNEGL